MLKAFSKVFHHKPQGQMPPGASNTTEGDQQKHVGELPSHTKQRTLERKRVSGLGLDSSKAGGAGGREESVGSGLPRHAPNPQQRSYQKYQQAQPRLHIKSASSAHAPDGSGRFPLTKENLEWHQRMLPPVKDYKYDRIVRYIQEQQQNVASAAVDPANQHLDIDASMLMSGQMQYKYNQQQDPYLLPQQPYQKPSNHNHHPYQLSAQGAGNMYSMASNNPATTSPPQHILVDGQFAQNNGGRYVTRSTSNGRMHSHLPQAVVAIDQIRGLSQDNEDEDNTPLAAINISTSPRQQPIPIVQPQPPPKAPARPNSLDIVPGSSLEKYMTDSLNDPLPEPISPTKGSARMSMMSFQSNMAVNFNPSEHMGVSRTHSLSNVRSPITRDSLPGSANSGSNGQRRPSLLTANAEHEAATFRPTIEENIEDDEPLIKQQHRGLERKVVASGGADSGKVDGTNDMDSEPEIALRVVNGTDSVHDSDKSVSIKQSKTGEIDGIESEDEDEDDNKPLMSLTGKIGLKNQDAAESKELKVVNTAVAATDDDDDDQPLSNLLAQPIPPTHQNKHFSNGDDDDDIGSLPLPAPRRVVDPDTVDDVNEGVASLGHSLSENSALAMSLRRSTSSARQRSSLLRSAVPIFADEDIASNPDTSSMAVAVNSDYNHHNYTLSDVSNGAVITDTNPRPTTRHSTQPSNLSGLSIQLAMKSQRSNSITRSVNLDRSASPSGVQQRLPNVLEDVTNEAIAESNGKEAKHNKDTSITLAMLASGAADARDSRDIGKPWMFTRGYSESATSLTSNRRAMRGSTLGQQLTDELHVLREDIARSQKEKEKADRRSWQIGAWPTAIARPWLRNENARSDPALPERRQTSQTMVNFQDCNDGKEQRPTTSSGIDPTLTHSTSSKPRPISMQPKRASRWFASNKKISGKDDNVSLSDMAAVSVDVDGLSTSTGGEKPKSLSSRINSKFGRLKRTFNS